MTEDDLILRNEVTALLDWAVRIIVHVAWMRLMLIRQEAKK